MLRPSTNDQKVLNERREQDQVFGLLPTMNDTYKDLIQHILRFDKLPSLNDVYGMIQKEEGARSLFQTSSEMAHMMHRTQNYGERRSLVCDHCKMKGHTKDKCWTLHPHLKPAHLRGQGKGQGAKHFAGAASYENDQLVRKYDLEALIQGIAKLTNQGKPLNTSKFKEKMIIDFGASHNMINDVELLSNMNPHGGSVVVVDQDTHTQAQATSCLARRNRMGSHGDASLDNKDCEHGPRCRKENKRLRMREEERRIIRPRE